MRLILLAMLLVLTGCRIYHDRLSVTNEYITRKYLASYHVLTPDPMQCCPPAGKRMTIHWWLEEEFNGYQQIELQVVIRLKNRELDEFVIPIETPRGSYVYDLLNDDYFCTGGILTYQILMVADGEVIDDYTHALWAELIEFDIDD